jgi:hypothetical protein
LGLPGIAWAVLRAHSKASLYEAFGAAEARRLVERFESTSNKSKCAVADVGECPEQNFLNLIPAIFRRRTTGIL